MRRFFSIIVLLSFLVTSAFAEIDLGDFSFDQLATLRDQIMREMMSRDEWQEVTVPAGTYQIGKHIPAGHWMIKPTDGAYCYITIGGAVEDNGKDIPYGAPGRYYIALKSKTSRLYDAGDPTFVDLDLKDGAYICIEKSSVVFTPYSGQPDLGFTFK